MDYKYCLLVFATLICTAFTAWSPELVRRNAVQVKLGTDECISNCSGMSSKGNVFMQCSIGECGTLALSNGSTAQASEIRKNDIFFERYTDEEAAENRLALHVRWSPVDNVSLKETKGYLIEITDGVSKYETCYHITTPMQFNNNAHDLFFNDCFGKAPGTRVRPGSEITVKISTLPVWHHDREDGLIKRVVEVPDCTNQELHTLKECEKKGGRPTTRQCATNCDTTSTVGGISYPVTCNISRSSVLGLGGPEKCDEVNKPEGIPTPPIRVPKAQEWYKFIDPFSKEVKIALNFSWMPRIDSSLPYLHGYYLEITPKTKHDLTNFNKCFSVHSHLTPENHSNTQFFYDCYGRISGNADVEPGHIYHVHLNSIPSSRDEKENFDITIPDCSDESVHDVTYCIKENSKFINSSVEVFCNNRSMKYTYTVSRQLGEKADVVFCERGPHLKFCENTIRKYENLAPSGTLYNIGLSSSANLSNQYTIFVHGTDDPGTRSKLHPDFSHCVKAPPFKPSSNSMLVIIILVIGILCVAGICFLIFYFCKRNCDFKKLINRRRRWPESEEETLGMANMSKPTEPTGPLSVAVHQPCPEEPAVVPNKIRAYVVFLDDFVLHKDVVHYFCAFLKDDLGIDVKLNIWENDTVAANKIQYMESNIRHADKVIIICSEGTKNCLEEDYDGNLFTPVVRKVCQEAFVGKNPGKFLVGYFPYSKEEHVPEMLRDQCLMYFSLFKLMKQFEPFYFRLTGIEQYQEGGIQRIEKIAFDRYHEPSLTKYGMHLKTAIEDMEQYVRGHPTWYNDTYGIDQPQALPLRYPRPIPSLVSDQSITDPFYQGGSIAYIHAQPPPGLPYGQQPKLGNTDSLPPRAPQQLNRHQQQISQPRARHGQYQKLPSITSASTDSSFIVDQSEGPHSSYSPIGSDSPTGGNDKDRYEYPPPKKMSVDSVTQSFHPESFSEQDFGQSMEYDEGINSSLLSDIPSNMTQITRLGFSESMENVTNELQRNLITPLFQSTEEGDEQAQNPQISPESGVFMLAPINAEELEDDLENQIKSINQSNFA